jgi:hypothetical protein
VRRAILAAAGAALALLACRGGPGPRGLEDRVPGELGPFRLFKEYREDGERKPLPAGKDLWLELGRLPGAPDSRVLLTFSKLSSSEKTGTRLAGKEELNLDTDGRRLAYPAAVGISMRRPPWLFERAAVEVPLRDVEAIAGAREVRGRLGGLSEFSLAPEVLEALRKLAERARSEPEARRNGRRPREPVSAITLDELADSLPDPGPPHHPVSLTTNFGDADPAAGAPPDPAKGAPLLLPTGWIEYPEKPAGRPLVGRMGEDEAPVALRDPLPGEADAALAVELARIVQESIAAELDLAAPPGLFVVLFPLARSGPVRIAVPSPIERGLAIGVPSVGGKLLPSHAPFILVLAHEFTEALLVNPYEGNRSLLYRDPGNRWIGEGMANLVLAHALRTARSRLGLDVSPLAGPLLHDPAGAPATIRLPGWRPDEPDGGRYAAAEYVCGAWYEAARAKGIERPIAAFAAWLRGFPDGPDNEEVLDWMSRKSGLDIRRRSAAVPLRVALRFEAEKWKALGLEPGDAVRRILDDPKR